ncbi:hypothetical protein GGF32_003226 [Allomyces javanicus]|nr:hypothetical protein GGF32_003226 [Allomyces javanicus]
MFVSLPSCDAAVKKAATINSLKGEFPALTLLYHVQINDALKWCMLDASDLSVLPLHQTIESPPPYYILVTANWQPDLSALPLMPRTRYRAVFTLETSEDQHIDSVMEALDLLVSNSAATSLPEPTMAVHEPQFVLKSVDQTSIPLTKCTFVAPDTSIAPR